MTVRPLIPVTLISTHALDIDNALFLPLFMSIALEQSQNTLKNQLCAQVMTPSALYTCL